MKILTLLLLIVVAGPASGGELNPQAFAVLALDARYHGHRAVYNDYLDAGAMSAPVFAQNMGADPLLLARNDRFYRQEQADQLYAAVPGEQMSMRYFDSGHSQPAEYTTLAVEWLGENL